jgi:hypothetical protein
MRTMILTGAAVLVLGCAASGSARAQTFGGSGSQGGSFGFPPPVLVTPVFPGSVDLSTVATFSDSWTFTIPKVDGGSVTGPAGVPYPFSSPATLPDTSASSWLGLPFTGSFYAEGGTAVIYSSIFSLAGSVPGTASLSGFWSAYGTTGSPVVLSLNGADIGELTGVSAFPDALTAFSADTALFLPDQNTLSVTFLDVAGDTGFDLENDMFRVEAAVTATPVPAPGDSAAGVGLLVLVAGLRRRRARGAGASQ